MQKPQGKGRPRFTRAGHAYTPDKTRSYTQAIQYAARAKMAGREPFTGRVQFILQAYFAPPASWSKTKREAAIGEWCVGKIDADNIVKVWSDAFNGIVFLDDNQIVSLSASKIYGLENLVTVTVIKIDGGDECVA
jgi:Holliday junction resolvase RusA-like endonuclease